MANITPLTAKLQTFKNTVSTSISSMETAKNEIANYLNEALTSYESAYNGITSAITDDQGKAAAQSLALVKQAAEVMKNSITNDMGNILSECKKISEEIARIEKEIERGNKLTPGWFDSIWNEATMLFTSKWSENDAGEIERINEDVEHSMKALESQLDAIASSSNSIRLGIIGNMVAGGTLGSYIDFASNYNFNLQQWKEENPLYNADFWGKAACFVVGGVEGAIKALEGLVDIGLSVGAAVLQGVGSVFGQDWSQNILSESAKFDVAGFITGFAYDELKSNGQYDARFRIAGKVVGLVSTFAQSTSSIGANIVKETVKSALTKYFFSSSRDVIGYMIGGIVSENVLQVGGTSVEAATTGITTATIVNSVLNSMSSFVEKLKGGSSTGGSSTGGSRTGGSSTGGSRTGGSSTGGSSTGGSSTGGSSTGGSPKGGSSTGGSPKGGSSTGGSPKGGSSTGGSSTGGSPKGGSSTGGSPKGGSSTGGSPKGGSSTGGSPTGGSSTGGSPTGGSSTGGSPTGGSPTGGSPTGGSSTGGSPKVTADNSKFGSISDAEFRAYQARNGIEVPTDELLKRVGITSDMDPFQMDILVTNAAKKRIINAVEGNLLKNYFGIQI